MVEKSLWERRFLETRDTFEGFGSSHFGETDIRGLGLDRPVLEKIYHRNFQSRAGEKPKPIDLDAVRDYARRAIDAVRAAGREQGLDELHRIAEQLETQVQV